MRLTFGLESWRIGLIVAGLSLAFAGVLTLGGPPGGPRSAWHQFAPAAAAIVGLLVVLVALIGRQTPSGRDVSGPLNNLYLFVYLGLPALSYLADLSPEWKVILGLWAVGGIVMAVVIARRRA